MAYGGLRGAIAFSLVSLTSPDHVPAIKTMICACIVAILVTSFIQVSPNFKVIFKSQRREFLNSRIFGFGPYRSVHLLSVYFHQQKHKNCRTAAGYCLKKNISKALFSKVLLNLKTRNAKSFINKISLLSHLKDNRYFFLEVAFLIETLKKSCHLRHVYL